MVDIIKQDMSDIWASSGDVTAPDSAKIATGWVVEAVPRQWWNWFENRQDTNIAYMLQKGIPEWDIVTEYLTNKSYVQRNNVVYKCTATNTGLDPAITPANWDKAFPESSASLEALRVLTPAADRAPYFTNGTTAALMTVTAFARTLLDDANVTTARTTLGAQAAHANLTALSGPTAVTNTFPYWNSATTMLAAPITAFGRSLVDDADAAAARTTLGLGSAALLTATTSDIDTTAGRATTVGDFGIGAGGTVASKFVPTWPNASLNDITGVGSGIYRTTSGVTNSINGQAAIVIFAVQNSDAVRATQLTISTDVGGAANSMIFRSCSGGTLAAPTWSTNEDVASKAEVYAQMAEYGLGATNGVVTTDLNTVTVTGFHKYTGTAANIPLATAAGLLINSIYDANYRTQIAITLTGTDATKYNRTFTRTYNNGTWGVWKESVDAASLTTTLSNYALNGANTDITSLTGITLNSTNGLSGFLSSNTADATTVPNSGGVLTQPKIRLSSNAADSGSILSLQGYQFTTGNFGSTLVGTRSYGAIGAHGAVGADRSVLTLLGAASDGTKYNPIGRIDYYTVGTQSGTNSGGEIRFLTTPSNTLVPTLAMTIRNNNNVDIVGALNAASLSLTTALPISSGGTGGTTAATARGSLQAVGYDAVTGSAPLPAGTTAQRTASPSNGMIRYNNDTNEFEGYQNGSWAGIGGGNPLFTVLWWPSRTAIPAGYFPADGQLLTRTTYSAAWARINAGDVPSITDANWTGFAVNRGYYSVGNGTTTFRVPDLNGKVAGSLGAMFLRGDGAGSTGTAAAMQGDAYQDHNHYRNTLGRGELIHFSTGTGYNDPTAGALRELTTGDQTGFSYTGFKVASETRPMNVTGVWIIKLIGGATAASQQDAAIGLAALDAIAYKRTNAVGTVSQSAGVPTGAIIETGTNAAGTYVRFADGTQICRKTLTFAGGTVANGTVFKSVAADLGGMPANFITQPDITASGVATASGGGWPGMQTFHSQSAWGTWSLYTSVAVTGNLQIWLTAIGRWY